MLADKRPPRENDDNLLYNFDRSRASIALGTLGAREYAPRLAVLLKSTDYKDRLGAALGLGYMGAKEYASVILKLLSDDEDQVQLAATQGLAELGAVEAAKAIAKLLTTDNSSDLCSTAGYALARLNATAEADHIAALLREEYRKGDAAKALALLGAKEYVKDIAKLTDDGNSLVRCDALISLGILAAKEHTEKVAAHLNDSEPFVRSYAAVSLLLMGDETHSAKVVGTILAEWNSQTVAGVRDPSNYFNSRIKLHPVLGEKERQLTLRAVQEWNRQSGKNNSSRN